jgi:hypothetical protein
MGMSKRRERLGFVDARDERLIVRVIAQECGVLLSHGISRLLGTQYHDCSFECLETSCHDWGNKCGSYDADWSHNLSSGYFTDNRILTRICTFLMNSDKLRS